jgi:stage II sporulation protein D
LQRIIIFAPLKKVLITMVCFVVFLFLTSMLIAGITGKKSSSIDSKNSVPKFGMNSNSININEKSGENLKIKLYVTKEKKVIELNLEEYVRGVVSGEMPLNFGLEALKAQAVAARTYALAHTIQFGGPQIKEHNGADLCDTTHCQVYMSKEERMNLWDEKQRDENWKKVTQAVNETIGQVLTYDGKLVMEPYYFSTSSGKTEDAAAVFGSSQPYLKSVSSEGDKDSPRYTSVVKYSYTDLANKVNAQYPKAALSSKKLKSQIAIKSYNEGGTVKELKIGNLTVSGKQFRELLELKSANFTFLFNAKTVDITCKGFGHDVGMSQWGAGAMAKQGSKYDEILKHYYQGVKLENYKSIK